MPNLSSLLKFLFFLVFRAWFVALSFWVLSSLLAVALSKNLKTLLTILSVKVNGGVFFLNKSLKYFGLVAFALALIVPSALSVTIDQITIDNKLGWLGMGNIQRADSNAFIGHLFFAKDNMTLFLPSKQAQLTPIGSNFLRYSATYDDAVLTIDSNSANDCNALVNFHGTASYVSLPNKSDKFIVFMGVLSVKPLNCSVAPFYLVITGKGTSYSS